MTSPTIVKVAEARHAFAARGVLNGVNLELRAGEIYCLLGVNGAGKTTLMRAICGQLKLHAGSVTCEGRDVYEDEAARE
ncbi:ATP-binding cassette domain-containing protein, partial [Acinetobacter baumannii]